MPMRSSSRTPGSRGLSRRLHERDRRRRGRGWRAARRGPRARSRSPARMPQAPAPTTAMWSNAMGLPVGRSRCSVYVSRSFAGAIFGRPVAMMSRMVTSDVAGSAFAGFVTSASGQRACGSAVERVGEPEREPLRAGPGDHGAVVGAQLRRRHHQHGAGLERDAAAAPCGSPSLAATPPAATSAVGLP